MIAAVISGPMAQSVLNEPVFDPTPVSGLTALLGVVATLGLLIAVVLAWSWVRSAREEPAERAFRLLSARMRLSRRGRRLVRSMAAESGVAPVGLLVSPSALRGRMGERPAVDQSLTKISGR